MGRKRKSKATVAREQKERMRSRRQSSVASIELAPLGEEELLARRLASPCEKNPSNAQRLEPPLGSLSIQSMDMPLSSDSPPWVCTPPRVPSPKLGVAGQTKLVVETSLDVTSIIETKQKVQEYNTETILRINSTEPNTRIYNTESNTTIYNTESILEINTEECNTESKQEINNELMQEMQTEPIPETSQIARSESKIRLTLEFDEPPKTKKAKLESVCSSGFKMLPPDVHLNIASGSEQSNNIKSVKVNGSSKNKINFIGGKVDIRNNKHSSDSSHYSKIRSRKLIQGKTENEETDLNLVDQEETRNEVRNLENTCSVNQPFMMQGSFHQGDDRFRNNSGKQCVANSLTAIAYSKLSLIDNWNMTFLDKILIEGNILYTWIHGDNEELLVTELPKMVEIRDMIVKCNRKESIFALIDNNGKIEFNVLSLDHALQEALIDSDGCFVCVRGFTSAIIRQNGKMYLFDSHARNCFGLQDSCGKSVVIQINDVNSLYQHFYNFVQGDVNAEFEVTGINIEIQDEDSVTNNLDKFIGNINNREVLEDENNSDVEFIGVPTQTCYLFNPIDYYTKRKLCNILDIKSKFVLKTPLMPTHSIGTPLKSKQITADGNCLFRAISYAVSNRQENFKQIRNELVRHILRHSHQFNSFLDSETVNEYMKRTNMIEDNVWGTELEIIAAADLLKTDIFTYLEGKWIKYSSKQICSKNNVNDQAIYLNNVGNHYEVVLSVLPGGKEAVTLNSKESAKKRNQSGAEKDQMNLHYELSHEGTMKRKYEQHELNFPKKCLKEDENSFGLIKKKTCLEWPGKDLAVCKPRAPNQGLTKNEKEKLKYQLDGQFRFNKIEKQNRKYEQDRSYRESKKRKSIQKYANDKEHNSYVRKSSIQKYADDDDFKREVKRASIQKYADDDDFKSKVKDQILTRRKNAKEDSNDVTKVIENFRKNVSKGPEFVCSCCFRLFFENQVVQCKRELYKPGCGKDIADICISEKYLHRCSEECKDECLYQGASRATLWICYTCHRKILKGKIPAESFANNLALEDIPLELNRLNQLEQHLISLNIPFMKIVALPKGGQKAVHGPCVCVPSDISKVTTTLPRSEDDNCLVKVKLKRKLQYKGYEEYQFVDTKHLEEALSFLKEKNDWYSNVEINGEWLNPIPSSENICVAEKKDNKSYTRTDRVKEDNLEDKSDKKEQENAVDSYLDDSLQGKEIIQSVY
ncbi:unnamed protein product [Mytilus edulis]|uniref:OTU domain-containing protein n=1 Tax=Mytilus edulis TaxID=6550 RepID=A0A8S3UYR7_MYTED|nr:unnamed protein product [Mytilus edulis]